MNDDLKYTVKVCKKGGIYSFRYVLACSAGGAERICMNSVFEATSALAEKGWGKATQADFVTESAIKEITKRSGATLRNSILDGFEEAQKEYVD